VEKPPDGIENIHPAPEGRRTNASLSPLRGWEYISPLVPVVTLGLHHRLISAAPPAPKTCVETFSCPVCAWLRTRINCETMRRLDGLRYIFGGKTMTTRPPVAWAVSWSSTPRPRASPATPKPISYWLGNTASLTRSRIRY